MKCDICSDAFDGSGAVQIYRKGKDKPILTVCISCGEEIRSMRGRGADAIEKSNIELVPNLAI